MGRQQATRRFLSFRHRRHVLWRGQVVRVDQRVGPRVCAFQPDAAAALRPELAHVQRVAVPDQAPGRAAQFTRMVDQVRWSEMKLQVKNDDAGSLLMNPPASAPLVVRLPVRSRR
jgi:hypothetical protein